jgi:hypothetical protein
VKVTLAMVAMLALPPEQYDHEPTRLYTVQIVEPGTVNLYCPARFETMAVGCTVNGDTIMLRNDLTPEAAAHVLRHEKGHINGWQHD